MLRLLAFVAVGIGIGAWWRRRHAQPVTLGASPADELRERLAAADERVRQLEPQPDAAQAPAPSEPDGRREDVHDRARRAMDELS